MNRKGFTLIELIATIAILGIIAAISFISIDKVLENSKDNECENIYNMIVSAYKLYKSDHRYDDLQAIIMSDIIGEGYIRESEVANPYNRSEKIALKGLGIYESQGEIIVEGLPNNCNRPYTVN